MTPEQEVTIHDTPCQDCGKIYNDWTLLPHELFNETCPDGAGILCFPCFVNRTSYIKSAVREARLEDVDRIEANINERLHTSGGEQKLRNVLKNIRKEIEG